MSGWLFLGATVLTTVAAQLAFKQYHRGHRRLLLFTAIAMFTLAVPCTYLAVRDLGIGRVYVGAALAYVITPLVARRIFAEHLERSQLAALALILVGVIVYNL